MQPCCMSTHSQSSPVWAITSACTQCGIESQPPTAGLPSRHSFFIRLMRMSLVPSVVVLPDIKPGAILQPGRTKRMHDGFGAMRGFEKTAMIMVRIQPRECPMQLTAEKPSTETTGSIRASFNYVVDTGVPPVRYIDWPEMAHKAVDPVY